MGKEDTTGASAEYTYFKLADYLNKGYFTLTFPLGNNHEKYAPGNIPEKIAPRFGSVQGVKFSIDWLYIGPMTERNPSAPSLYFGFGNNRTGHLLALCKALLSYSDSAKAFFVNQ